jgi:hypothetical protein
MVLHPPGSMRKPLAAKSRPGGRAEIQAIRNPPGSGQLSERNNRRTNRPVKKNLPKRVIGR